MNRPIRPHRNADSGSPREPPVFLQVKYRLAGIRVRVGADLSCREEEQIVSQRFPYVVIGALLQTVYEAFPDERQTLYEQYRGAFAKNLSLATGSVAVDLSQEP
jgi:hypothetical protein